MSNSSHHTTCMQLKQQLIGHNYGISCLDSVRSCCRQLPRSAVLVAGKGGHKAQKGSPPYSDDGSDHSSDVEDAEDYRKGGSMP